MSGFSEAAVAKVMDQAPDMLLNLLILGSVFRDMVKTSPDAAAITSSFGFGTAVSENV